MMDYKSFLLPLMFAFSQAASGQLADVVIIASFQFVDKKKAKSIVFSYVVKRQFEINYSVEPVRLKGLEANKKYRVRELNLFPNTVSTVDETAIYTGDYLMKIGINPDMSVARKSVVLEINEIKM